MVILNMLIYAVTPQKRYRKSYDHAAALFHAAAWHNDRQNRMGVFCVSRAQSIMEIENWWGTETQWRTESHIIIWKEIREGEREVQAWLMREQKLSKEEIKIIAYSKRRKFETSRVFREGLRERADSV